MIGLAHDGSDAVLDGLVDFGLDVCHHGIEVDLTAQGDIEVLRPRSWLTSLSPMNGLNCNGATSLSQLSLQHLVSLLLEVGVLRDQPQLDLRPGTPQPLLARSIAG